MGVDISKDPRYYYKQFYDDNPENAWNLLNGKADTSILEQYKNKAYDKAIDQQQKKNQYDSINDLMDYS